MKDRVLVVDSHIELLYLDMLSHCGDLTLFFLLPHSSKGSELEVLKIYKKEKKNGRI